MNNYPRKYIKNIVFNGNSLFARGNANVDQVNAAPMASYSKIILSKECSVFNFNTSGINLSTLITNFSTIVQPSLKKGDIVICNEVTNTLNALQNVNDVYQLLLLYRDLVVALGCKFICVTMTARGTGYTGIETDRLALNSLIKANSVQFDAICDAGGLAEFNSVSATTNTTYYNADTLHFTTVGYALYGGAIADTILPLI